MAWSQRCGMIKRRMQAAESFSSPSFRHAAGRQAHLDYELALVMKRSAGSGVKRSMDRVRIIFVVVVPALWLVTSGQWFVGRGGSCIDGLVCVWASGCQRGERCPAKKVYSFEQSARPINSRIQTQSGPDNLPLLGTVSYPAVLVLTPLAAGFPGPEGPAALAKWWQFEWRTAREPRAPSSAS